jgi:hypothetical protein
MAVADPAIIVFASELAGATRLAVTTVGIAVAVASGPPALTAPVFAASPPVDRVAAGVPGGGVFALALAR